MTLADNSLEWLDFPQVPDELKSKYNLRSLFLRRFACLKEDIDIDFNSPNPQLITQLLECCTKNQNGVKPENNFFRELAISKRVECLLKIAAHTVSGNFSIQFRCSNELCGKNMEIDISYDELLNQILQEKNDAQFEMNGSTFHIKRPTALDQLEWQKYSYQDELSAANMIINSIVSSETDSNDILTWDEISLHKLNEYLEDFDQLITSKAGIECPHCNHFDNYLINPEELAISVLHQSQKMLINTIHELASNYHWNENDVLAIPHWRRKHYLTLLGKE